MGKLRHRGQGIAAELAGGGRPAEGISEGSLCERPAASSTKGWRYQGMEMPRDGDAKDLLLDPIWG